MLGEMRLILRARIALPVVGPPIENAAVLIERGRVIKLGFWPEISRQAAADDRMIDLGSRVLLPGLINAHCHLDYTWMAGKIPPPRSFADWIKSILVLKGHAGFSEYAQSWIVGARQALLSGTTTVGDIEAVPELLPEVWGTVPIRILSYLEMTGVRSRNDPQRILRDALEVAAMLPRNSRHDVGLSPHAPYSTPPNLLLLTGAFARRTKMRISMHVAESSEEFEMFMNRSGALHDWLREQRDMSDCGAMSPVRHLHRHGLLSENLLAVHANYLAKGDIDLLAESMASVAHCPRSHLYFSHQRFDFEALSRAGINICLGTDSLASMLTRQKVLPTLDLREDMKVFAQAHPDLDPAVILRLATINPARALGRHFDLGQISPGSCADIMGLPYFGPLKAVHDHVVNSHAVPEFIMVNGVPTILPQD